MASIPPSAKVRVQRLGLRPRSARGRHPDGRVSNGHQHNVTRDRLVRYRRATRPDVNSVFNISGNHGFDIAIDSPPGNHRFDVYAINVRTGRR